MTRGLLLADPRVDHADLACGFAFSKLTAACQRALAAPVLCGPNPRIRTASPKMIPNLPLPVGSLSRVDTPIA